jgi:hypothetical protein
MSTKAEIQGVALALFGAYAGAYLKDLTEQATKGSVIGVANGLVILQPALLARDFESSDEWVDHTLLNLGLDAKSAAFTPAKVWFLLQLGLGRTKADALTEAVRFLLGIASGAVSDSNYENIADAFDARVVQGIRWSEDTSATGGAGVKALVDLKAKAATFKPGTNGSSTPTDNALALALADVLSAADALAAGKTNTGTPNDALTEAAEVKAESLIRDSLGDGTFVYNQNETSTGQTTASNNLENAAETRALSEWATIRQDLLSLVSQAENDLSFMRQGASGLVDVYLSQLGPARSSREALLKAETDLVEALSAPNPSFPEGDVAFDYDSDADTMKLIYLLDDGDEIIATLAAGQWTDGPATGAATSQYKSLSEAYILAWRQAASGEASLKQVLTNLESLDGELTSADNVASVDAQSFLTGDADFYFGAALALKEFDSLVASAKQALGSVKQLRGGQVDNTALQKALTDAKAAFVAQGYTYEELRNGDQKTASSKDNVYDVALLIGGANTAKITGWGLQGDDGLLVHGYTRTTTSAGDNNVLEFKLQQSGADTVITFESVPNGFSSDATGNAAEFTVTLMGVDSTKLSFEDGLILS